MIMQCTQLNLVDVNFDFNKYVLNGTSSIFFYGFSTHKMSNNHIIVYKMHHTRVKVLFVVPRHMIAENVIRSNILQHISPNSILWW